MKKIKTDSMGFGAIEVVIILSVIALIIVIATFVITTRNSNHSASLQPQSSSKQTTPSSSSSNSTIIWRDATITQEISASNEKVVSSKKVTVAADVDWVDTGLQVVAGQHIWLTTDSAGSWSGNPQYFSYSDAKGSTQYPGGYKVDANANVLSLIGYLGTPPVEVPEQSIDASAPAGGPGGVTDPGLFEPGNTLKDFSPKVYGKVWLRNNDNTNLLSDVGKQTAEVYITQ
jgi:hypothetical protein